VTELLGYLGLALMLAGAPVQLGKMMKSSRRTLSAMLLVSLFVLLIPWNGHSLIYYVRGVVGDLSVSSVMLLILLYANILGWPVSAERSLSWQSCAVIVAILIPLYASTLGYWSYDLYAWGYQPQWMLAGVGVLLAWAWHRQRELAIVWLLGVVAFAVGLCPSVNLWDALFDPFMMIGSIAIMLRAAGQAILQKKNNNSSESRLLLQRAA
jgi:hypothetical protein